MSYSCCSNSPWSNLDICKGKIPVLRPSLACISPTVSVATSVFGRELRPLPNGNLWRWGKEEQFVLRLQLLTRKGEARHLLRTNLFLTLGRRAGSFLDLWTTVQEAIYLVDLILLLDQFFLIFSWEKVTSCMDTSYNPNAASSLDSIALPWHIQVSLCITTDKHWSSCFSSIAILELGPYQYSNNDRKI